MRVLIIGGTRFVGYFLTWRLIARGHPVTLFNRGATPDPFGERIERIRGDRTRPGALSPLRGQSFDAVVDFAAYHPGDVEQVLQTFDGDRAPHYVFISTGQVYLVRTRAQDRPSAETDFDGPTLPRPESADDVADWQYGIDKRACEERLIQAFEERGFPSTRLRLPMVHGERDYYRRIESYLWRLLDGGEVLVPDGGALPMRHVYAGSVVDAIDRLLTDERTFGQVYNLAQDETPTLSELLGLLAQRLGAEARLKPIGRDELERIGLKAEAFSPLSGRWMSFLDPAKAKAELGFRHASLESYLDRVVASFLAHPPAEPPANYQHRRRELELAISRSRA